MVLFVFFATVFCYKPIIFIHGLGGSYHDFDGPKVWISEFHPGTKITSINFYNLLEGFVSLEKQVPVVIGKIREVQKDMSDGYHLVCHSQGGVICRAAVQMMDDHKVDRLILMSGPVLGQYGIPKIEFPSWLEWLKDLALPEVSDILYTQVMQRTVSFANYWFDPLQPKKYLEDNVWLTQLNNQTWNPDMPRFKRNFLRINHMYLLTSPKDGIIKPYQSCHFGYFDIGNLSKIVPMKEQFVYVNDPFGLKTLDLQGKVTMITAVDVPVCISLLTKVYVLPLSMMIGFFRRKFSVMKLYRYLVEFLDSRHQL